MLAHDPRLGFRERFAQCLSPLTPFVALLALRQGRLARAKLMVSLLFGFVLLAPVLPVQAASQRELPGPPGSGSFGESVTVLPNGNIVVTDPLFSNGTTQHVGAVYLYNGATDALISTLTGSAAEDQVGGNLNGSAVIVLNQDNYLVLSPAWGNGAGAVTWVNGATGVNGVVNSTNSLVGSTPGDQVGYFVTALTNGNYVVLSPFWHNDGDSLSGLGAVTWGNGATGVTGVVNSTNSLVGSMPGDQVGSFGSVIALNNGNYVVSNPTWHSGPAAKVGAVTWGNGMTGVIGVINSTNSLVGGTSGDRVGWVTALRNGNYIVSSPHWHNGPAANAGAVTWGNGATGVTGVISRTNSLIGDQANDFVGAIPEDDDHYDPAITALTNGNYVVSSPNWHDNGTLLSSFGAVTWGNGTTGVTGVVSSTNSLVGSTSGDQVGWVTALSNGNYVVSSPNWRNAGGPLNSLGAVTWASGATGIIGVITSTNSLVGTTPADRVGIRVTALTNGNYVVSSPFWHNSGDGYNGLGAVTWVNGATSVSGVVSSSNSLVGSTPGDRVGYDGVTALSNGNYVALSSDWHNGGNPFNSLGAATWGNGTTGVTGVVSNTNSLVGSTPGDRVGSFDSVTVLSNGNYVIRTPSWHNDGYGGYDGLGAVTWGNGATGITGMVSSTNSLVGSTIGDEVGDHGVIALSNGNYIVNSPGWDDGERLLSNAGAVTWGNGTTGVTGIVSRRNSLIGSRRDDDVGSDGVFALANGNYVVHSGDWHNGTTGRVGAMTWGDSTTGVSGEINFTNSVLGVTDDGGFWLTFAYDAVHQQLVVGRPKDNSVTLFDPLAKSTLYQVFLPAVKK